MAITHSVVKIAGQRLFAVADWNANHIGTLDHAVDLVNVTVNQHHAQVHTIVSHDTTATGAELNTLTDGSNSDSLHIHEGAAIKSTGEGGASKFLREDGDGSCSWQSAGDTYVDRGDPAGYDFQVGNFITDGTWRTLDLSAIVPAGATAVSMVLNLTDNLVGSWIMFRKNGNANFHNRTLARTQVANIAFDMDLTVFCDANRVIEYQGLNTAFTRIDVVVKGWFI